jgi:hypothetical protein
MPVRDAERVCITSAYIRLAQCKACKACFKVLTRDCLCPSLLMSVRASAWGGDDCSK